MTSKAAPALTASLVPAMLFPRCWTPFPWHLPSFFGGVGKGTARDSHPPALANTDRQGQGLCQGFLWVTGENTEAPVASWGL